MENILSIMLFIFSVCLIIGLILATFVGIYYLIKLVFLDIKSAEDYKQYWKKYYNSLFDERSKELKIEYESKLESMSKEYFKEFYDEAMKKKEEQNESA